MTTETQHTEWKESWRDEYLKWLCAFANTEGGGELHIGVDDTGKVVGITQAKKLLEDLPNKTRDLLGVVPSVELLEEQGLEYLIITVEHYPFPVSYKGKYYLRSGSTLQELRGAALNAFILSKQGKKWDGVPLPYTSISDLSQDTLDRFKVLASKSKRVDEEVLEDTNKAILENLLLTDGKYLKRAAVLLFHKNPEKFFTGCSVKIGFFRDDEDLVYQDEVSGNLIKQADEVLDILRKKYFRATIDYSEEGVRLESYEWPERAVREAVFNAIAHKDYEKSNPTQISVYEDKIIFWNEGQLPEGLSYEDLRTKHPSKPQNPDIARTMYRAGFIEAWGRGTVKMIKACKKAGLPEPIIERRHEGMYVEFRLGILKPALSTKDLILTVRQQKILAFVKEHKRISNSDVQTIAEVSRRTATRELTELADKGILIIKGEGAGVFYVLAENNVP